MSLFGLLSNGLDRYISSPEQKVSLTHSEVVSGHNRSEFISKFFNLPQEKKLDFIKQYGTELWVYICINRIAQSLARVPIKVFRKRSTLGVKGICRKDYDSIINSGVKLLPYNLNQKLYFSVKDLRKMPIELLYKLDIIEEAIDSPIQRLLDKSNPFFTKYNLLEGSVTYLELRGNAFIEMVGEREEPISINNPPVELWHLNPDKVAIIPDKKEFIKSYVFTVDGTKKIEIPKENIIHIKYFNPQDPLYYGQGTVEALVQTIRQEKNLKNFQNNFYKQGMKPSAVLTTPDALTTTQFNKLISAIEENYSGLENMHRPLLLEGGMKWQSMSITQRDSDMLEFKKLDREELLAAFGVPPVLVGLPTENFATAQESRRAYYLDTIMPKAQIHEEKFNQELVPLFGDDLFVRFDFTDTPAKQVDKKELKDSLHQAFIDGGLSRNEYRRNLGRIGVDISDIDLGKEGDKFFISSNLIPLDDVGLEDEGLSEEEDSVPPKRKPKLESEDEEDDKLYFENVL